MDKVNVFDAAVRRIGTFAVAFTAAVLTAASSFAAGIISVSDDGDPMTRPYKVGEQIYIAVDCDSPIVSVVGNPYLKLDIQNVDTSEKKAVFDGFEDSTLYFVYEVGPGDYTSSLDIISRGFEQSGAVITFDEGGNEVVATRNFYRSIPSGDEADGSLKSAGIQIRTISFDDTSFAKTETGREGQTISLEITRQAISAFKQNFTLTATESATSGATDKILLPSSFSIPAGAMSAYLDVKLIEKTAAGNTINLVIHPSTYTDNGGDLTVSLTITEGQKPAVVIDGSQEPLEEGAGTVRLAVSLERIPNEDTTVTVTSSSPGLAILSGSTLTWRKNEDSIKTVLVQPLDGNVNATITATPSTASYSAGTFTIFVQNVSPVLVSPPKEDWEPAEGGEGFPYTVSWSSQDVTADMTKIRAKIIWGDGETSIVEHSPDGTASHTYETPGTYGITVIVEDTDGGSDQTTGLVTINPAVAVLINEYKHSEYYDGGKVKDGAQNTYAGFASGNGYGRGTIDDNLAVSTRTDADGGNANWEIKYSPTTRSVNFTATPERFTLEEKDAKGNTVYNEYDSFFHVWVADEGVFAAAAATTPIAPVTAKVNLGDGESSSDAQIGGVFAREHYPEDGCADLDFDGLPDIWEQTYLKGYVTDSLYPFESVTGDCGTYGNPDGEYLPAGCMKNEMVVYPLKGNKYVPNGIEFSNIYEVRGFHHGLNKKNHDDGLSEDSFLPGMGEGDEPHEGSFDGLEFNDTDAREFYGTDPTNPDSDGDTLLDGWEYYWWLVGKTAKAGLLKNPVFERYDPKRVIIGTPIDPDEIIAAFHPLVPCEKGMLDLDGDGLSNFEEMLLGTNPCHWDTDGDTMNDAWEVMWGLDPFNPKDALDNPDGDYMAYYATSSYNVNNVALRHCEVYARFGFDPRTAWKEMILERNRQYPSEEVYAYAPNTMPYFNVEEHYLGRWCIDMGFTDEVEPTSGEFMTQPTPKGTYAYFAGGKGLKAKKEGTDEDEEEDIDDDTAQTDDYSDVIGSNAVVTAGASIEVPPLGSIYQTEIGSHGCDTDGDGMPDGWELYVSCGSGTSISIWPAGKNGAKDASKDLDVDNLENVQECHGTELWQYYTGIYSNFHGYANSNWYNKFWPCDPWNPDTDGDGLTDWQEGPHDGENPFCYTPYSMEEAQEKFGATTLRRGHIPGAGLNPCSVDTDMDYIPDFWEHQYAGSNRDTDWEGGFVNEPGTHQGGGMDGTYFDSVSTYDEYERDLSTASATNKTHYIDRNGVAIRDYDFDHDGLENYQEYFVNGVAQYQYDKWLSKYNANRGVVGDYGDYDAQQYFNGAFGGPLTKGDAGVIWKPGEGKDKSYAPITRPVDESTESFDWAYFAENWQEEGGAGPTLDMSGRRIYPFYYMPAEVRPRPLGELSYASTDPRLADTDSDNMDDYWEIFHGLNPILGGSASSPVDICNQPVEWPNALLSYDFRVAPWMTGMPNADPDQDNIPNWEEALSPNQPSPANHNTDPSPLWMTDISYSHSFANLYYSFGTVMNYWTFTALDLNGEQAPYTYYPIPDNMVVTGNPADDPRPHYVFSFEQNEGFDTDNDNLSDEYEISGSAGSVTDPQNCDAPVGRKALYLDGNAAARTRSVCAFGKYDLRSWTIEAWVKPENPASGKRQVILERPVTWDESDNTPTYERIRRTFRLGIEPNGCPFVEYNNGGKDVITEAAKSAESSALKAGEWYHLAASFDGVNKRLSLYINGELVASKATTAIPYTGFTASTTYGIDDLEYNFPRFAPIVLGAADSNPEGNVDGGLYYYNGTVTTTGVGQPSLSSFFKGWIDEVRIWTGVRPGNVEDPIATEYGINWGSIKEDVMARKRYTLADILDTREKAVLKMQIYMQERYNQRVVENPDTELLAVEEGTTFDEFYNAASAYLMGTGGEDATVRIPAVLLASYNFDNLPDPDYGTTVPAKFETRTGRPLDYTGVPWLIGANDRTTVYRSSSSAPYTFPHYIENAVSTLPLGHLFADKEEFEYDSQIETASTNVVYAFNPYRFRADHVVDSKYWTRDTTGGVPCEPGFFNSFPNTSNPYGQYYSTGRLKGSGVAGTVEAHPVVTLNENYDPVLATLFNHLIPLRNAKADMSIQLWDDPTGEAAAKLDSDGDGLPDWWEYEHGMDPFNADQNGNGIPDGQEDFDNDGLSNRAEYLAGLDPWDKTTNDTGINDYDDSPFGGLSYGAIYTDNDYVLDTYEELFPEEFASTSRYDEHEDRDLDGWNNWSEALVGTALDFNTFVEVDENAQAADDDEDPALAVKARNIPLPDLSITLHYHGKPITGGKLVVHAYSDMDMNGWPDAVFVKDFGDSVLDTWPMSVTVGMNDLTYGHLRQGPNWFFAWLDNSGNTIEGLDDWAVWDEGEPAAIADNQLDGIEIGFDLNEVTFHITDKVESYARKSFFEQISVGEDHYVTVEDQNKRFKGWIKWPRTWIHEGDIIAYNVRTFGRTDFGLGAHNGTIAASDSSTRNFNVKMLPASRYLESSTLPVVGVVSNWMHATVPAPTLLAPVNGEIVAAARPEFRFNLFPEATEFQFTLKEGSTVLYTQRILAPGRFYNGASSTSDLVVWKFPYCVGDLINGNEFKANTVYTWTVGAITPTVQSATAKVASGTFRTGAGVDDILNIGEMSYVSGGKGCIDVDVSYPSQMAYKGSTSPVIRIQAFRSKSFNGLPDASVSVPTGGVYRVYGLEMGVDYYVRAYIDSDGDGARSNWESWGYYRDGKGMESPFMPVATRAVVTDQNSVPVNVVIRDADTDNDLVPDAYEYAVYTGTDGKFLSLGAADSAAVLRATAFAIRSESASPKALMAVANKSADSDSDGVSDAEELLRGLNPFNADADGDGIIDSLELKLFGSVDAATTPQAIRITNIGFDADGTAVLDWTMDGAAKPSKMLMAAEPELATTVNYALQGKVNLDDPEWVTIRTISTKRVDNSAPVVEQKNANVDASAFRFFRVKLIP